MLRSAGMHQLGQLTVNVKQHVPSLESVLFPQHLDAGRSRRPETSDLHDRHGITSDNILSRSFNVSMFHRRERTLVLKRQSGEG